MDFTLRQYKALLTELKGAGYNFQTFDAFVQKPLQKAVVLRHDVDLLPYNALDFANIQASYDILGTYYFRAVPESWDEVVIQKIAALGHEIGYHYECLTTTKGDKKNGIKDFETNLKALRKLASVTTICMHGSPLSRYDSKALWNDYNYTDFGILAEPYFDIDYQKVFYLTDTGRMWDGHKTSVRDKVNSSFTTTYHSTSEVIVAIANNKFPDQVIFTFHPQRWNDNLLKWCKELVLQNVKNTIKKNFYVK